jgi:hypothetical protein
MPCPFARRAVAIARPVREGWRMAAERLDTSVRAASELAVRRAALDQALAAADDEHADVDPIDVIDCALAVQAAEALVSARDARG